MKFILKNVRLAFPDLWEAKSVDGEGEAKFGATFLIPYGNPQIAALNAAMDQVAAEKWGAKAPPIVKTMRATEKVCMRDGEHKTQYQGYEGHMYVSARNAVRPIVLDANKAPLTKEDGRPYSGCYVNATVDIWAQDNKFGRRINASLAGVQFLRHGDAFSGGIVGTADDFDDVSEGVEADDLV